MHLTISSAVELQHKDTQRLQPVAEPYPPCDLEARVDFLNEHKVTSTAVPLKREPIRCAAIPKRRPKRCLRHQGKAA